MITHGFIVALYLYPLNARLYSQLLHRPPGMSDVIGTVSLRRHPGQINTATKKNKEKVKLFQQMKHRKLIIVNNSTLKIETIFLCTMSYKNDRFMHCTYWTTHVLILAKQSVTGLLIYRSPKQVRHTCFRLQKDLGRS